MEKNKDNIDELLENQYGIDAINEEYASDAETEDNRTSFEKENDEKLESMVVESKVQGDSVIIKKTVNEDNNIKNDTKENKSNDDYSMLEDVPLQKDKNNLAIVAFILSLFALVFGITFLVISILYLFAYKDHKDTNTYLILLNVFRYTDIAFILFGIVVAVIASNKKGMKKLITASLAISIITPIVLILATTILPTIIK